VKESSSKSSSGDALKSDGGSSGTTAVSRSITTSSPTLREALRESCEWRQPTVRCSRSSSTGGVHVPWVKNANASFSMVLASEPMV
jgi:hypothetical protein